MPAFRSVVSVLVSFVGRSFSTNSRPALRAASGRPPARQRHDGHRGAGRSEPGFRSLQDADHALAQWTGEPSEVIVIAMEGNPLREDEIFAKSHAQVLEDLKLLDDKLGRIVVSLAFLTGAAVALFSNLTDKPKFNVVPPRGADISIPEFTFLTFIVAAGLSLLVALAGTLMVGLASKPQQKFYPSLFFFKEITANLGGWEQLREQVKVDSTDRLTDRLADNFHTDALEIAKRARYKQLRALESLAFLHLAIVSLVLFVIFVANVHDFSRGWWIASVFLIVASLLPLVDALDLSLADYPEDEGRWNRTYDFVLVTVVIAGFLLFGAPYWGGHWYALPYALFGAILAPRVALVSRGHALVVPLAMGIGVCLLVGLLVGLLVVAWFRYG
jgi:hypothetical protein